MSDGIWYDFINNKMKRMCKEAVKLDKIKELNYLFSLVLYTKYCVRLTLGFCFSQL